MLRPDINVARALGDLPLKKRLAALTYSVIVDPRAVSSAINEPCRSRRKLIGPEFTFQMFSFKMKPA